MDLRFVAPHLSKLDEIDGEILVASVFSDLRPAGGVAGLADFRLAGVLSRLMEKGFITGQIEEVVMIPGKPKLSYEKLLIFGGGPLTRFDDASYLRLLRKILRTMQGLSVRTGVVELPGRQHGAISAQRAADILLTETGGRETFDAWTLVEDAEGRAAIEAHMVEQKRRVRRQF